MLRFCLEMEGMNRIKSGRTLKAATSQPERASRCQAIMLVQEEGTEISEQEKAGVGERPSNRCQQPRVPHSEESMETLQGQRTHQLCSGF